jgi:hypothetical protein
LPQGAAVPATTTPKAEASLEDLLKVSLAKARGAKLGENVGAVVPAGPPSELAAAAAAAERAVSGELLPKAVAFARDALPAPAKGTVRLWRVEGASAKAAGAAAGKTGGNWYERNLGAYATKSTKPGDVRYVDVPEAEFAKLQADPNATEVQLGADLVAKAKSLTRLKPRKPEGAIGPYEEMTPSEQLDHVISGDKPAFVHDGKDAGIARLAARARAAGLPVVVKPGKVSGYSDMWVGKDQAKLDAVIKAGRDPAKVGKALGYTDKDVAAYLKANPEEGSAAPSATGEAKAMIHGRTYKVGDTVLDGPSKGAKVLAIDQGVPTLSKMPTKGLVGKRYGEK